MNAKTDGWESYTDDTGRRHWRWPAIGRQMENNPRAEAGPRQKIGLPEPQQAQQSPQRPKGK
ncbi:MAG: hypothetical protein ABI854_08185 [Betaproteobacteria bacterium]